MTNAAGENYGAIDIVCNAFTPDTVNNGWMSTDKGFREKVRVKPEYRDGVTPEDYITMMDRCGIERSFLIAQRSGDLLIQGSAHMPTEYIAGLVEKYPDRYSGLIGIDPDEFTQAPILMDRGLSRFLSRRFGSPRVSRATAIRW